MHHYNFILPFFIFLIISFIQPKGTFNSPPLFARMFTKKFTENSALVKKGKIDMKKKKFRRKGTIEQAIVFVHFQESIFHNQKSIKKNIRVIFHASPLLNGELLGECWIIHNFLLNVLFLLVFIFL